MMVIFGVELQRVARQGEGGGEVNPRGLETFPLHRGSHCFFESAHLSSCGPPTSSTTPAQFPKQLNFE